MPGGNKHLSSVLNQGTNQPAQTRPRYARKSFKPARNTFISKKGGSSFFGGMRYKGLPTSKKNLKGEAPHKTQLQRPMLPSTVVLITREEIHQRRVLTKRDLGRQLATGPAPKRLPALLRWQPDPKSTRNRHSFTIQTTA